MNKLKESILNDATKGSGDTTNEGNESTSATKTATTPTTTPDNSTTNTATSDIYGLGILAVLSSIFFVYNTSQAANKIQVNERQDQPPKRRNMLQKIYNK